MNRRRHREDKAAWLDLMETDGPFLAVPVVKDAWPAGLETLPKAIVDQFRAADDQLTASSGKRDTFIRFVLAELLEWADNLVAGPDVPPTLVTSVPEHRATIRPTYALVDDPTDPASPARALVLVIPAGARPTARPAGDQDWSATYTDRLAHALRAQNVPVGLVTNGTDWVIVGAPTGTATSTAAFTRYVWREEADTLRAFVSLVGLARFYGVPDNRTLPALLTESITRQTEITEALSAQSQAVVEMFVASIGRSDSDHKAQHGQGLLPAGTEPSEVYEACVTVLMRMVFLLYAEERGLLPADDDTYARAYAITTLTDQLTERADHGEDALERSSEGWQRLLATSRAIHRGTSHDQLALPAYGGSLFDPDRFPWLEGRADAAEPLGGQEPVGVDDRTLLKALQALQTVTIGGVNQSVSFRVLDVEQIGYVYEGLLDQDANIAADWVLGIAADARGEKNGPELSLTELETQLAKGDSEFAVWLSPLCNAGSVKRTPAAIRKALGTTPPAQAWAQCLEACGGNAEMARRVLRFHGLLRTDPRGLPVVYPPKSLYLTDSSLRSSTGAVYTPRWLAEEVVVRTLEPLVKSPGPLDTEDESEWRIRTPQEILDLKVIDIAAGSGAFLASATRYLADSLIEAERTHTPTQATEDEQAVVDARRRILDHCIYGVDINPMAVEMCKLSLWLITLDKARPFGFLDDRVVCGDSLLGVSSLDQLEYAHFNPRRGRELHEHSQASMLSAGVGPIIREAAATRTSIAQIPLTDSHATQAKESLLHKANEAVFTLRVLADSLSAASLKGGADSNYRAAYAGFELSEHRSDSTEVSTRPRAQLNEFHDESLFALTDGQGQAMRPAHFPLIFPEVFHREDPGFDAVVGNPPYLGAKRISGAMGEPYREHLVREIAAGRRGNSDLVAYFVLRGCELLRTRGVAGFIATDTLTESHTLRVGLGALIGSDGQLYAATTTRPWPAIHSAATDYVTVFFTRRTLGALPMLDHERVDSISADLTAGEGDSASVALIENAERAFVGVYPNGSGFLLSPQEADVILSAGEGAEVIRPYLDPSDITDRSDRSPSKYVIDLGNRSLEQSERVHPVAMQHLKQNVYEYRQGRNRERHRTHWWQFAERRPGMLSALDGLDRYLAMPRTSKAGIPVWADAAWVPSDGLVVFATADDADYAVLASTIHWRWAVKQGGSRGGTRLVYNPQSCFNTLPLPGRTARLETAGATLGQAFDAVCRSLNVGLTGAYNAVNDPGDNRHDVVTLRNAHVQVDQAVCDAYGWSGLELGHGFHPTPLGTRWTVTPAAQTSILVLLAQLNAVRAGNQNMTKVTGRTAKLADSQADLFEELA